MALYPSTVSLLPHTRHFQGGSATDAPDSIYFQVVGNGYCTTAILPTFHVSCDTLKGWLMYFRQPIPLVYHYMEVKIQCLRQLQVFPIIRQKIQRAWACPRGFFPTHVRISDVILIRIGLYSTPRYRSRSSIFKTTANSCSIPNPSKSMNEMVCVFVLESLQFSSALPTLLQLGDLPQTPCESHRPPSIGLRWTS
jgi:hypothetical protein